MLLLRVLHLSYNSEAASREELGERYCLEDLAPADISARKHIDDCDGVERDRVAFLQPASLLDGGVRPKAVFQISRLVENCVGGFQCRHNVGVEATERIVHFKQSDMGLLGRAKMRILASGCLKGGVFGNGVGKLLEEVRRFPIDGEVGHERDMKRPIGHREFRSFGDGLKQLDEYVFLHGFISW